MVTSVAELINQLGSSDFNARARALAALVQQGSQAIPALTKLLLDSRDDQLRVQAAQALAEIADPTSAETFVKALNDSHAEVRARAAQGLAFIKDHRAVDALVQTLNDFPDVLHYPHTLSTHILIQFGLPVLPAVVPLLKSSDLLTRQRSFLIIQTIVSQLPEGDAWHQLWQSLGSYAADGPAEQRSRGAAQWAAWIELNVGSI